MPAVKTTRLDWKYYLEFVCCPTTVGEAVAGSPDN